MSCGLRWRRLLLEGAWLLDHRARFSPLALKLFADYRGSMIRKCTLAVAFLSMASMQLFARGGGGGGFHEGGFEGGMRGGGMEDCDAFRMEAPRIDAGAGEAWHGNEVQADRDFGGADMRLDGGERPAEARLTPEGNGMANVNIRTVNGRDYDANVVGPDGFRNGYVWQNGDYVAVNLASWSFYAAPYGPFAGWNVMTTPDCMEYPVYSTYPVETSVELALQKLGLYSGPIDGLAASCAGAIEQYQMQNSMPVTGTISPELLTALGIQANFQ